jgi:hypothetical protein
VSGMDLDALLVALVLAPATYSRNRFFDLYADPRVRRVRRRASLLRSVVRHLARLGPVEAEAVVVEEGDDVRLTYVVPSVGLRRISVLAPFEMSLVRFALGRGKGNEGGLLAAGEEDREVVEAALGKLVQAPWERSAEQSRREAT